VCEVCGHQARLRDGACRLCWKQAGMARRSHKGIALAEANRHGQQLFLANMEQRISLITPKHPRHRPPAARPDTHWALIAPAQHRQLTLIDPPRRLAPDFRWTRELPDPALAAALERVADDHAEQHGWDRPKFRRTRLGLRVMLGTQDTIGPPIKASDVVALLPDADLPAGPVMEVLAAAGLLEDDRVSRLVVWINRRVAELPEQIAGEVLAWFDVMHRGSTTPPRRRPRPEGTIHAYLNGCLPALKTLAETHESLREVSRQDVLDVLPASGTRRVNCLRGLRSIFQTLKDRKLVFIDPTARIFSGTPDATVPMPMDVHRLRWALDAEHPAAAAMSALLIFHALRAGELRNLQLTDVRDGRLHLDDRIVPLADEVRTRIAAWLDHRRERWPNTNNSHLFINQYTATRLGPISSYWLHSLLDISPQKIREDRILNEAQATGGDARRVCDLFGLTVGGAVRYTGTLDHPGVAEFRLRTAKKRGSE
jgi:integrase